ncbi:radical SAM protein [Candidatus Shapirobacteria bacterium CG03_land_8_20_14_0_80_40_19]|uniref:Radical SAM protein n=1 Tax=Candidatus Shapirobacteria bacterium CG03_land_8_20_14_0_80_40_19 TaxID=1974880 RepID=A0A2M7BB58_9BACT|nr:MAG: radical SAM protein [Candidatus Shapirobacteria bacterium CG03_land_8_20_14_0_80_40_19]
MRISWYGKYFGEEPPISGQGGSGTIFFCGCNLKCVFCQNWQISQGNTSCETVSEAELLKIIFNLHNQGAGNINLVSPTIWAKQLIEVLKKAKQNGLKIPVVWNSNGYEKTEILKKLEGLIDIYLPDCKYSDEKLAIKYSSAPEYPKIAQKAILEMFRQVGVKGLIVRHLILPRQIKNSIECLKFIRSISPKIYLSLMTQYNPTYKAKYFPEINRKLNRQEYNKVLRAVKELRFENGWIQKFGESADLLMPDFSKKNPFNN